MTQRDRFPRTLRVVPMDADVVDVKPTRRRRKPRGALPCTVETPTRRASGDQPASTMASASSWPGSQSSQIGTRAEAEAEEGGEAGGGAAAEAGARDEGEGDAGGAGEAIRAADRWGRLSPTLGRRDEVPAALWSSSGGGAQPSVSVAHL